MVALALGQMPSLEIDAVQVVKASISDIPSIHRFILSAWKEAGSKSWGWTGATDENVRELASEVNLRNLISDRRIKLTLGKLRGRILGFSATRQVDEHTMELSGIIVQESSTGKGVGTALIKEAIADATRSDVDEIVVKTEPFNKRAISFYERNGFVLFGPAREDVGGVRVDVVVLSRKRNLPS